MNHTKGKSTRPISNTPPHRRRVNWHEAAACAIEIDLRDYADILQFLSEYILGKNSYRIDFLVIKKLSIRTIPRILPVFSGSITSLNSKDSTHP